MVEMGVSPTNGAKSAVEHGCESDRTPVALRQAAGVSHAETYDRIYVFTITNITVESFLYFT